MKKALIKWLAVLCALLLMTAVVGCAEKHATPNEPDGSQTDNTGDETPDSGGNGGDAPAVTADTYRAVYAQIGDFLVETAVNGMTAANTIRLSSTAEDIYTEAVTGGGTIAASAYIYLAAELYKNDDFVITEDPVRYTVSGDSTVGIDGVDKAVRDETEIFMKSVIAGDEITLQFEFETVGTVVETDKIYYTDRTYLYIRAGYDFTANEILTLSMHIWSVSGGRLLESDLYENGIFRQMNEAYREEVSATVTGLRTAYLSECEGKVSIGDFSAECDRANAYLRQKMQELMQQPNTPAVTADTYRAVYAQITDVLIEAGVNGMSAANAIRLSSATEEIYTEVVTGFGPLQASAYIYLASELYKNDDFEITADPVLFSVHFTDTVGTPDGSDIEMNYTTDVYMKSIIVGSEITLQLEFTTVGTVAETGDFHYSEKNYLYVQADYDFSASEIRSFIMHWWEVDEEKLIESDWYENGIFRQMNPAFAEEVAATVTEFRTTYESECEGKVSIGDFSEEFERTNEYIEQKMNELMQQPAA